MTIYNLNVDLVYNNVYKNGSISLFVLKILKMISDFNQGPLLCCKFAKNDKDH